MKHTLEHNENSLKNDEQHLENNEKSLNAVPDSFKGFQDLINKVRMPPRFLTRYAVFFLEIHVFPPRWHYNFRLYHIMKKTMKILKTIVKIMKNQ